MAQRRPPPGFGADGAAKGAGPSQPQGLGGFGAASAPPAFRLASASAPGHVGGGAAPQPLWPGNGPGGAGAYPLHTLPPPPSAHGVGAPPATTQAQAPAGGYLQPPHQVYAANGAYAALGSHTGMRAHAPAAAPGDSYGHGMQYPVGPASSGAAAPPPPLQPGIIGELPPELRHAAATDTGSALLRMLQRNSAPAGPLHHSPHAGQLPPGGAYGASQIAGMMSDLRVSGPPSQGMPPYGHITPPAAQAMPPHAGLRPLPHGQQLQQDDRPGGGVPFAHWGGANRAGLGPADDRHMAATVPLPRPSPPLVPEMLPVTAAHVAQRPAYMQSVGVPLPRAPPMPVPPEDAAPQRAALSTPSRVNQREVREAALAARSVERAEDGHRVRVRPPGPAPLKADPVMLSNQLSELVRTLQPSDSDVARQMACFERVRAMLQREWPDAQLHMYGSCANGFGGPSSDIDTCLALRWADTQDRKRSVVQRIAELAASAGAEFTDVLAITHARMPVAKLHHVVTGVRADVCVNNFLAVYNTRMLRDYARLDTRMRQLGYCVKHWAKRRSVNEPYTGTLSSYCYILMCIHLLQTRKPPVLPCLQTADHTFSADVEGMRIGYSDDMRRWAGYGGGNTESLAQLLHAFFDYWAWRHDYGGAVVCIRTGGTIPKRRKGWTTRVGTERHLICIEDPFETSHDLGRVVDKRSIGVLREEFERAERILRTDPNPLEALFQEYVQPPFVKQGPARGQAETEDADDQDVEEVEDKE